MHKRDERINSMYFALTARRDVERATCPGCGSELRLGGPHGRGTVIAAGGHPHTICRDCAAAEMGIKE